MVGLVSVYGYTTNLNIFIMQPWKDEHNYFMVPES